MGVPFWIVEEIQYVGLVVGGVLGLRGGFGGARVTAFIGILLVVAISFWGLGGAGRQIAPLLVAAGIAHTLVASSWLLRVIGIGLMS